MAKETWKKNFMPPPKKGERRGGRKIGMPNRATIEGEAIAKYKRDTARGKMMPDAVLDECMLVFRNAMIRYMPGTTARPNAEANEAKFVEFAKMTVDAASRLAPYRHPTFRAISITPPPPESGEKTRRFTITAFGNDGQHLEIFTPVKDNE